MSGAADAEAGPAWWHGTVVEYHRVSATSRWCACNWTSRCSTMPASTSTSRCRSARGDGVTCRPAIPAQTGRPHRVPCPLGVAAAWSAPRSSSETRSGDRWRLSSPHGALEVDRDGGDVLMVAGSTGLAPLRAMIMDLARFGVNPRVHLFFGARYPCELYDLRTLWEVAASNPWLSVTPVSEYSTDPPWAADYPDVQPPRGLHVRQTGLLPEVVTRYGGWGDRQILICGGPAHGAPRPRPR